MVRDAAKHNRAGFALVTVLLFSGIILMMVLALFQTVRGRLFTSQNYRNQTAALYLAETGLWDAVAQLEVDPTWTAGFKDKSQPGVPGTYNVVFNTTGARFTDDESVNNSDGSADANYRGAGFVPPGCANLIVTANVGGYERQIEALVRIGGGLYPAVAPIMTSGRVDLRGSVNIDGRKSQADPTRVEADVHSNKATPDPDIVVWDGNGEAFIDGKVSVVAPNGSAINIPDTSVKDGASGKEVGAAQQPIPDVNIKAKVQNHRNAPAATITGGTGVSVLSPASASSKDRYYSGDLNIQGDLVLDGVDLYVEGDLHINGSITGSGSIFVTETTTLQGDARIASATPDAIALFSEGNVKLSGFNGTEYMDALAVSDPNISQAWSQLSDSMRDYHDSLSEPGSNLSTTARSRLNKLSQEIGGFETGPSFNNPGVTVPGRRQNVTQILIDALGTQPDSTAKTRMTQKFQDLNSLFYSFENGTQVELQALQALSEGRIIRGGFDAAVDKFPSRADKAQLKALMKGYIDSIDYDHLGAAFFQGVIFTHGSIYTDAEVTVQGALAAFDNGSQDESTINGENVNPGDLILQPLTRVSYIEEFFKPKDASGGVSAAGVQLLVWMGR